MSRGPREVKTIGNNPAVGLSTRKWLAGLSREETLLDDRSRELMLRVLDACREHSPCGTVFDLAMALGAAADLACLAGSVSELFFAVCSYTDDIQDGDTDRYMDGVSPAIRLNVQSHLNCLVAVRAKELADRLDGRAGLDMVTDIYRTGAAMLNGQCKEIARDPWNIEVYEEVARRIAGDQYGTQFRLAASASGADPESWSGLGKAYGSLLQLVVDHETGDERLLVLQKDDISRLSQKLVLELREASIPVRQAAGKYTEALLQRWPQAI